MKSSCAVIAILSLLLIDHVSITESRKDLAKEYWRNVMKDQPMPKAIHGLMVQDSDSLAKNDKTNFHEDHDHRHVNDFTDEFKPIPDITAYPDDHKTNIKTGTKNHYHHHVNAFTDEFEPIPDVTAYPDDDKTDTKTGAENHYHYHHHVNAFTDEFEPIPDLTAYPDDHKKDAENHYHHHANAFTEKFEPIPNVTGYLDDCKTETKTGAETKPFAEELEPSPNISVCNE